MKKLLISFLLVVLFFEVGYADPVTIERAQKRAEQFFSDKSPKTKSANGGISLVYSIPEVATKANGESPFLYVFEQKDGGYVIISGEESAHPVLGYSLNGSFPANDIPDNMSYMLKWYAEIIDFARQNNWAPNNETLSEWNEEHDVLDEGIVLLDTPQWSDQHTPFNDLCPIIDGEHCPTGCVAAAIATIMRYHEWPKNGTGHLDSYDYYFDDYPIHIEGHDLGHEYKWDEMPFSRPLNGYSKEQSLQIAQLLYDVGVMLQMHYTPKYGSGSSLTQALLLAKYFGYDKGITYRVRIDNFSAEWEQIIKKEIKELRPVLYAGYDNEGGHAFVVDGYRGRYFHTNGEGSFRPGHDPLDQFYTFIPIDGHEEDLIYFNIGQQMVYQIQPDTGEYDFSGRISNSPQILKWTFKPKDSFDLEFGFELNLYDYDSFESVDVSVWLFNEKMQPKEMISDIYNCDKTGSYRVYVSGNDFTYRFPRLSIPCKINTHVNHGDRILVCFKNKKGDWVPLMPNYRSNYIEFSNRPLSELISIGYTNLNPFPNDSHITYVWNQYFNETGNVFYITGYKDVYWEIYDVTKKEIVAGSDIYLYGYIPRSCYSDDTDNVVHFFQLPSGNYQLIIRNIEEEVIVDFSI